MEMASHFSLEDPSTFNVNYSFSNKYHILCNYGIRDFYLKNQKVM